MEAKKVIITGGATRIGAAIAKSLVSFDTKIVIHFNKSKSSALKLKKELEGLGAETYLLKADLNNQKTDLTGIQNDVQEMKEQFYTISNGEYANLLFGLFGKDRVELELFKFLSHDFVPRYGGGIGVTRMVNAMIKEGVMPIGEMELVK